MLAYAGAGAIGAAAVLIVLYAIDWIESNRHERRRTR